MPDTVSAQSLPVAWVLTCGKQQQVLRPCSRSHIVAPSIPPEQLLPLPAARVLTRKARSVTYTPRPSSNQKKDASSKRPPPTKASYMIYLLPMGLPSPGPPFSSSPPFLPGPHSRQVPTLARSPPNNPQTSLRNAFRNVFVTDIW
jgi:hypothetical protein